LVAAPAPAAAAPARRAAADGGRDLYNRAMTQEGSLRDETAKPTLAGMRRVVAFYDGIVRRFPASGYADNALWQAANLSALAFDRFGDDADRKAALRFFARLTKGYPSSTLVKQSSDAVARLQAQPPAVEGNT